MTIERNEIYHPLIKFLGLGSDSTEPLSTGSISSYQIFGIITVLNEDQVAVQQPFSPRIVYTKEEINRACLLDIYHFAPSHLSKISWKPTQSSNT